MDPCEARSSTLSLLRLGETRPITEAVVSAPLPSPGGKDTLMSLFSGPPPEMSAASLLFLKLKITATVRFDELQWEMGRKNQGKPKGIIIEKKGRFGDQRQHSKIAILKY